MRPGCGRSSWHSSSMPSGPPTASFVSPRSSVCAPTRIRRSARGGIVSAESVKVAGVAISNPDKVWWPDEGITKSDIARFYDGIWSRSEEHTSELQSHHDLVCRLLLEK